MCLQRAAEIQAEETERRKREAAYFEAGKKAYERGQYENSVSYLEKAVEQCGRTTILGGQALMWLALAYQVFMHSSVEVSDLPIGMFAISVVIDSSNSHTEPIVHWP